MRSRWGSTLTRPAAAGGRAAALRRAGPAIVWSPTQRALLTLWGDLRSGDELPQWADLPAEDIASQGDTLMSLDLMEDGGALRFRIASLGPRLIRGYGEDMTGRFVDETMPIELRANAIRTYQSAIEAERPLYNVIDILDRKGALVRLERLLLPFAGGSGETEHMLVSIEASSLAETFDERQIGRSPYADPSSAVVAVIEL